MRRYLILLLIVVSGAEASTTWAYEISDALHDNPFGVSAVDSSSIALACPATDIVWASLAKDATRVLWRFEVDDASVICPAPAVKRTFPLYDVTHRIVARVTQEFGILTVSVDGGNGWSVASPVGINGDVVEVALPQDLMISGDGFYMSAFIDNECRPTCLYTYRDDAGTI